MWKELSEGGKQQGQTACQAPAAWRSPGLLHPGQMGGGGGGGVGVVRKELREGGSVGREALRVVPVGPGRVWACEGQPASSTGLARPGRVVSRLVELLGVERCERTWAAACWAACRAAC